MDCYFRQSWYDRRLRYEGPLPQLLLASKVLKDIWHPDTYIRSPALPAFPAASSMGMKMGLRNGRQSYLHTLTVPNILLRVNQEGLVYVSQRFPFHYPHPHYPGSLISFAIPDSLFERGAQCT